MQRIKRAMGFSGILRHCLWLIPLLAGYAHANDAPKPDKTEQTKASFLLRVLPYITWQDGTFDSASSPITVCIPDNIAISHLLREKARGKRITDSKRSIVIADVPEYDGKCEITYLTNSESKKLPKKAGLLIGATPAFQSHGTAINFFENDGKVRFDIYPKRLKKQGVSLSSELLKLAQVNDSE